MKTRGVRQSAHAQVRQQDLRGAPSQKRPPAHAGGATYHDPTVCEGCGAVYTRKTWRLPAAGTQRARLQAEAVLGCCPACVQTRSGTAYGRILLRGRFALDHEVEIRSRAQNVAARAGYTQPERRIVSFRHTRPGLEILTTSQKLAHRIARELEKAFQGRASLSWSDRDGRLTATWKRIRDPDTA